MADQFDSGDYQPVEQAGSGTSTSRRNFVKAAWAAPAIIALQSLPKSSYAGSYDGSAMSSPSSMSSMSSMS